MTTITLSPHPAKIAFPSKEEWRSMLYTPSVFITLIVCGTLLSLAVLAGVVFLAYTGNDAAVIGTVIGAVLTAVIALMNVRVKQVRDAVKQNTDAQA
jgi:uncharacterized membrane protein